MQTPEIIFFDIDGTLVDLDSHQPSPNTLEALRRLQQRGIRICIATGRSPMALPQLPGIQMDAYLTYNGSLCRTREALIFARPIPAPTIRQILRNAEHLHKPVTIATASELASNGYDPDLAAYFSFAHLQLQVTPNFDEIAQQEIYQMMLPCRESEYGDILAGTQGVKILSWWENAGDIVPSASGKGAAIAKLLEHWNIPKERAMAFGDGNNDVEMFQAVGTGVAMANASPALKAVARDTCGHVAQDGIYHYCLSNDLI